jgi:hypothetical protein
MDDMVDEQNKSLDLCAKYSIARVELLKLYLDTRVSPVLCHVVSPRPIFFPHTTGNAKTTAFHEAPNIF